MTNDDIYLRQRVEAVERQLDKSSNQTEGSLSAIVQTTTVTTYPTIASQFYAVVPLLIDGSPQEGALATFTPVLGAIFYAYNMGISVPPVNTRLIVTSAGGRWVFRYDGDGS